MTYLATKFEVATSNSLGADTFTRNVMDTQADGWTTDWLCQELNIAFILKKKEGIKTTKVTRVDNTFMYVIAISFLVSRS